MNKYLLTDEAKKAIAMKVLGTTDGFRPIMPRRGELIQEVIDVVVKAQHVKTVEMVLERIGEDFVEMIANFYMNEENKQRAFQLWQSLKREILEVSNE